MEDLKVRDFGMTIKHNFAILCTCLSSNESSSSIEDQIHDLQHSALTEQSKDG